MGEGVVGGDEWVRDGGVWLVWVRDGGVCGWWRWCG